MDTYSNNKQIKALNPIKEHGPLTITKKILVYMPLKQSKNTCVYSFVDLTESGTFVISTGEIEEIKQEYKEPYVTIIRCAEIELSKNFPNKKEIREINSKFYLIVNSFLYDYKIQSRIKEKITSLSKKTSSQNIVGLESLIDEIKSQNFGRRQKKKGFLITPEQKVDIQSYKEVLGDKYRIDKIVELLKIENTNSKRLLKHYIMFNRKLSIEDYEDCIKIKREIDSLERIIYTKTL